MLIYDYMQTTKTTSDLKDNNSFELVTKSVLRLLPAGIQYSLLKVNRAVGFDICNAGCMRGFVL